MNDALHYHFIMADFPSFAYHVKPLLDDFIKNATNFDKLSAEDFGSLVLLVKKIFVYSDPLVSAIILCLAFSIWVWILSTITRNFSQVLMWQASEVI